MSFFYARSGIVIRLANLAALQVYPHASFRHKIIDLIHEILCSLSHQGQRPEHQRAQQREYCRSGGDSNDHADTINHAEGKSDHWHYPQDRDIPLVHPQTYSSEGDLRLKNWSNLSERI